jgi:hypothetical protein
MFQAAKVNGSKFCGPTSLSALTGIGTKEICRAIRKMAGLSCVKGLKVGTAVNFLRRFGMSVKPAPAGGSLAAWCSEWACSAAVHLVMPGHHYVVINGKQIICTQFQGQIADLAQSQYLRCRVKLAWEVGGTFDAKGFADYIRDNKVESTIGEGVFKRQLNKMAKRYGVEIDEDRGLDYVWVYWPDLMIASTFQGVDPFEGKHFFDSYRSALEAVTDVIKGSSPVTSGK